MQPLSTTKPVAIKEIQIHDEWFDHYVKLAREKVIPYQYLALHDEVPGAAPSHAVHNLKIAGQINQGETPSEPFRGFVFQDSDLAKWLEAVGYALEGHPDPDLEAKADGIIDLVEQAQCPDGYLNTYFTINGEQHRWKNLCDCHELYVAGHFIEAAVAYYEGTGKRQLLDIVCRFVDLIDTVFGPNEGQIHGYPGHEEIELALVRLYRLTQDPKHLKLAEYFVTERGQTPNYFEIERKRDDFYAHYLGSEHHQPNLSYTQADKPVLEQEYAQGHAVRAVYLYLGMAEVAAETANQALLDRTIKLWEDIVQHQMYVTGGIGQSGHLERFTCPDDLPNDANYSETCASIGLALLSLRLGQITGEARFHDIAELQLYNGIAAGISEDGAHFFYVNPMEVWPPNCMEHTMRGHVKPERQAWFPCACCPPNVARTYAGLARYILSINTENTPTLYVQQYIDLNANIHTANGDAHLEMSGQYAIDGQMTIKLETPSPLQLALRIPSWSTKYEIEGAPSTKIHSGFLYTTLDSGAHQITLRFNPEAEYLIARPEIRHDRGLVALRRGPIIWAVEQHDNGENLAALLVDTHQPPTLGALKGRYPTLVAQGARETFPNWPDDQLYQSIQVQTPTQVDTPITFIPYAQWGNRDQTPGEMRVWLRHLAK